MSTIHRVLSLHDGTKPADMQTYRKHTKGNKLLPEMSTVDSKHIYMSTSSLFPCITEKQSYNDKDNAIGNSMDQGQRSFNRTRMSTTQHSASCYHHCDSNKDIDDDDSSCVDSATAGSCFSEFDAAPSVLTLLHTLAMQQVITVGRSVLPLQADPQWAAHFNQSYKESRPPRGRGHSEPPPDRAKSYRYSDGTESASRHGELPSLGASSAAGSTMAPENKSTKGKFVLSEPRPKDDTTEAKSEDTSEDLLDMHNLRWAAQTEMSNVGQVNLTATMHPTCSFRSHDGCNAFAGVSEKFCSDFLLGGCDYGCLCNKRHEPYARYDLESSMWVLTQESPEPTIDNMNWDVNWLLQWADPNTGHRLWATRES